MMRDEGYGAGYRYAHGAEPEGINDRYLPEEFQPMASTSRRGAEGKVKERLERWQREREKRESKPGG